MPSAAVAGLAFGLSAFCGVPSILGGAIVFLPSLSGEMNPSLLAAAFSLTAGVMLFVSFAETYVKSHESFTASGYSPPTAMLAAGASFFAGILLIAGLEAGVDDLQAAGSVAGLKRRWSRRCARPCGAWRGEGGMTSTSDKPVMAHVEQLGLLSSTAGRVLDVHPVAPHSRRRASTAEKGGEGELQVESDSSVAAAAAPPSLPLEAAPVPAATPPSPDSERAALEHLGLITAVTLGLNNIPEGLATFIAVMASPATGIVVTLATSLQSLLEGAVIAVPIYYATRSKWRAFGYASLAGMAPVLGGCIALAAVEGAPEPATFGVIFGVVSGALVWISMQELLPAAFKYDPTARVTPYAMAGGMAIVLLSLIITAYHEEPPVPMPCLPITAGEHAAAAATRRSMVDILTRRRGSRGMW